MNELVTPRGSRVAWKGTIVMHVKTAITVNRPPEVVYAFWRGTIERFGGIYGEDCRPLLIDAHESLSIDSPADWDAAERLLAGR